MYGNVNIVFLTPWLVYTSEISVVGRNLEDAHALDFARNVLQC